ncbi:MAG: RAD55 family ATPase [Candidatus Nanohaloarchaea archaeon]
MSFDTGIEGLKELVEVPEDYILLLGGPPGTGKSAVAVDYIFEGVENGEKGLYITLTQAPEEIKESAELRGHDPESENFRIQEATDLMRAGSGGQVFEPEKVVDGLRRNLNEFEPDRVVFDTVTKYLMIFDAEPVMREHADALISRLKEKEASALFIAEVPFSMEGQPSRYEIAEFVVDGILRLQKKEKSTVLDVLKMKGLGYSNEDQELEITDNEVALKDLDGLDESPGNDSNYADAEQLQ